MTAAAASTSFSGEKLPPEDEIGILDLAALVFSRWRVVATAGIGLAVLVAAWSMTLKPVYTAETSFMPQAATGASLPAGLAGLAGQFGGILGGGSGQTPRVYVVVLRSATIANRVLTSKFPVPGRAPTDSAPLLDILNIEGETLPARLNGGRKALSGGVDVSVDNLTGVVRVSMKAPDPALAANIANRFVEVLNEFNTVARISAARDRSQFTQERMADAERSLRDIEGQLRRFYETNRSWQLSPQLVFEEGRLRRQVDLRQEVYVTLAREYERARIEQVNEAPVITVIDKAVAPLARSSPARRRMVMLGGFLGGLAGVLWVFLSRYVADARRTRGDDFLRFRSGARMARGRAGPQ